MANPINPPPVLDTLSPNPKVGVVLTVRLKSGVFVPNPILFPSSNKVELPSVVLFVNFEI